MKILVLDTTTKLLKAVLASAATTSNPEFFVSYVDANDQSFSEASVDGGLNGTTQVTLVAAPSSGYKRTVKSITVYNKDTVSQTISIILDNSGTQRTLEKFTLAAGASWHSDSSSGTTTTPGGSTTQVQYNNSGAFAGIVNATTDGTTLSMTSPKIITGINDTNGNELIGVTATFSAGVTSSLSTAVSGFKIYTVTQTSTTSETVTFS